MSQSGTLEIPAAIGSYARWIAPLLLALVGSFGGAMAAFAFEGRTRKKTEDKRNLGAANRASTLIYQYWNALEQYRQSVLEPYQGRSDAWLNAPAFAAHVRPTDRFQLADLLFLLEKRHPKVYLALILEEQRFDLVFALMNERSRLLLQEAYPRLSKFGIQVGQSADPREIEGIVGIDVTHRLQQLLKAIDTNVREDLASLSTAHSTLHRAMKAIYPDKEPLKINFDKAPTQVDTEK